MDGGDDEVGEWDLIGGGFGDEGKEGDEFCGVLVVGLVVDDYAWFVGGWWAGWDGGSHAEFSVYKLIKNAWQGHSAPSSAVIGLPHMTCCRNTTLAMSVQMSSTDLLEAPSSGS